MKKVLFFICSFFMISNVYAESITCNGDYNSSLNISKTLIDVGDTIEVKATKVQENMNVVIKYDVLSGNDNIRIINNTIKGMKYGNAEVKMTVEYMDGTELRGKADCSSSLKIDVSSVDVSLKSLSIAEYDMSKIFKSDVSTYNIVIPYEVENINISAEANDSKATVTGTGIRYLNEGTQSFMVIVKNGEGHSRSYEININRSEASNDSNLKNITIDGYLLTPKFDSKKYEYKLIVDEKTDTINVKAEANNAFASIEGLGKFKLTTGTNKLIIKVTSQSGVDQTYTINITKLRGTSLLTSLKVSKYKLDKKFNRNTFIYNIKVYDNVDKVKIVAGAKEGDKVKIVGNQNLKYGRNEIYIKVYSKDKTTSVYKINVFKINPKTLLDGMNPKADTLSRILLIIFVICIIGTAGFILVFIKRNYIKPKIMDLKKINKKSNKNKNKSKTTTKKKEIINKKNK